MTSLKALADFGQAVWLDFLARGFLAEGRLKTLIAEDGLTGVTSNPAIFEKAIGRGTDYTAALDAAEHAGDRDPAWLYESLAVADIQAAADALRPVYQATGRDDGYVSLEVSPYLAMDSEATVAEAERLWRWVTRDNLMIKVPATRAGLPAIRRLIGKGINVNVTLLFAQEVYEEVAGAYLAGLEDFCAAGGDPSRLASVASFFVSRIDSAVDRLIDDKLPGVTEVAERDRLAGLRGKVAIANAKLAYQRYKRLFAGPRWQALRAKGARPQRLLWASTGTKDPAYRDVLYVEELIGRDTVNTMPPATMDAFRDHGRPRASLEEEVGAAERVLADLARSGISLAAVTSRLVEEGVRLFADAADQLLATVARQRAERLGTRLNSLSWTLPEALHSAFDSTLETWRVAGNGRRLWARDARLWTGADEANWLDWLAIVDEQRQALPQLMDFAAEVRRRNFAHILLLGMGGSSLGPEVLATTFGRQTGAPELLVLDSTDPAQIRRIEQRLDLARTLVIVASKSGSTLEPDILERYFFERVAAAVGADAAGGRFVAITDQGSQLEALARTKRFGHVFFGLPAIGGRYSVLSHFGMVPAAAMGLDLARFLDVASIMVRSCAAGVPPAANPGLQLGLLLGTAGRQGRDKVTLIAAPGIADLGAWLEQLVAESTGKHGKALIPVDREPLAEPASYGGDRIFVHLQLASAPDAAQDSALDALARAGHPVIRIVVSEPYHLGQEFFRWEIATAAAGAVLGINPFDQPDVEASKIRTRELTQRFEKDGTLPDEEPFYAGEGVRLYSDKHNERDLRAAARSTSLADYLAAHLARLAPGDYCALLAYLERSAGHEAPLQEMRRLIRDRYRVATCLGFGPRFLHSTGQAYKGGPNSGVFLQITGDDRPDLGVPGRHYGFGVVKAAQARGDFAVLAERGRRVLRVHLEGEPGPGLERLAAAVRQALG